jgi:hypothetical protein
MLPAVAEPIRIQRLRITQVLTVAQVDRILRKELPLCWVVVTRIEEMQTAFF